MGEIFLYRATLSKNSIPFVRARVGRGIVAVAQGYIFGLSILEALLFSVGVIRKLLRGNLGGRFGMSTCCSKASGSASSPRTEERVLTHSIYGLARQVPVSTIVTCQTGSSDGKSSCLNLFRLGTIPTNTPDAQTRPPKYSIKCAEHAVLGEVHVVEIDVSPI
jgi:hypothetical protein